MMGLYSPWLVEMDVSEKAGTHNWQKNAVGFFMMNHGIWGKQTQITVSFNNFDQWIGLRENLQETMVFTIKYRGFL